MAHYDLKTSWVIFAGIGTSGFDPRGIVCVEPDVEIKKSDILQLNLTVMESHPYTVCILLHCVCLVFLIGSWDYSYAQTLILVNFGGFIAITRHHGPDHTYYTGRIIP